MQSPGEAMGQGGRPYVATLSGVAFSGRLYEDRAIGAGEVQASANGAPKLSTFRYSFTPHAMDKTSLPRFVSASPSIKANARISSHVPWTKPGCV